MEAAIILAVIAVTLQGVLFIYKAKGMGNECL